MGDARSALNRLADVLAADEHRAILRVFMDYDTMDARLGDKPIVIQEYAAKTGGWTRCSLIPVERSETGKNNRILLGLRQITAEKAALESQDNLIQALAISYENIYAVNADDNEAICYRMGKTINDRYGQKFAGGNYERNIATYIENDVLAEDRHLFDLVRTTDSVNLLLANKKTYYFNYRVMRNHAVRYFQCQLVKPNPERNEFVIAFKDVNEEKELELAQQRRVEEALAAVEQINAALQEEMTVSSGNITACSGLTLKPGGFPFTGQTESAWRRACLKS